MVILVTARKQSLRRLCFHRCLSVHGVGGSLAGGSLFRVGVCVWGISVQGVSVRRSLLRGSLSRGLCQGGLCPGVSVKETPVRLCAGDTHPTGMHSCNFLICHLIRHLQLPFTVKYL